LDAIANLTDLSILHNHMICGSSCSCDPYLGFCDLTQQCAAGSSKRDFSYYIPAWYNAFRFQKLSLPFDTKSHLGFCVTIL